MKNQGDNEEHNFGHGKQHLSSVFAKRMLLAFLIDQIQELCCKFFQSAVTKMESRVRFWERLRSYFFTFKLPDWVTLYQAICLLPVVELPVFITK